MLVGLDAGLGAAFQPTTRPRPSMRALALLTLALAASASAQSPPRVGFGFDVITALYGQDLIPDGPALGVRGRVALPVNADVSVAASLGVGAHLFSGSSDARYVLNPQTSVIVTLPRSGSARYVLGGFGGVIPFSDGGGGPTIHLGYGWALPLRETSFFAEVQPVADRRRGQRGPGGRRPRRHHLLGPVPLAGAVHQRARPVGEGVESETPLGRGVSQHALTGVGRASPVDAQRPGTEPRPRWRRRSASPAASRHRSRGATTRTVRTRITASSQGDQLRT